MSLALSLGDNSLGEEPIVETEYPQIGALPTRGGYDESIFLDADKDYFEALRCHACKFPAKLATVSQVRSGPRDYRPLADASCSHVFCYRCLAYMAGNTGVNMIYTYVECTTCSNPERKIMINLHELQPDITVRKMLNRQKVQCERHEQGCTWTGEFGNEGDNYVRHLTRFCDYAPMVCSWNPEHKEIFKKDLSKHEQHICEDRPYECPLCAYLLNSFREWPEHRNSPSCTPPMPCPNGCYEKMLGMGGKELPPPPLSSTSEQIPSTEEKTFTKKKKKRKAPPAPPQVDLPIHVDPDTFAPTSSSESLTLLPKWPQVKLQTHMERDCPYTLIECPYEPMGCTRLSQKKLRIDMQEHLIKDALYHTQLAKAVIASSSSDT